MFSSALYMATLVGMLGQQTIASAIPAQRAVMTLEDSFPRSDLSYQDWTNKMVAEGKMYRSPTNNITVSTGRASSYSLSNIVCGYLAGPHDSYDNQRDRYCNALSQYVSGVTDTIEYIFEDDLCDGNQVCSLAFSLANYAATQSFLSEFIPFCESAYESLWNDCQGQFGGYADVTLDTGGSGNFGGQYFPPSEATCPASGSTICVEQEA